MLDATSDGVIVKMTSREARELIAIMTATSQQFGTTWDNPRRVNKVNIFFLEYQISQLTYLVQNMVVGNAPQIRVCGICAHAEHPIDMCPTFQEGDQQHINVIGGFPNQPQRDMTHSPTHIV